MVPVTPSTVAMMMTSQHSCVESHQYHHEYLMEEWQLDEQSSIALVTMVTMTTTLTTAVISVT